MECGGCARPRRPTRTSRPPPDRPRGSRRPRRPRSGPRAPRARERRWCGTRRRPSARASLEHLGDHVARPAAHRSIEVSRARAERTEGEHLDREIDGEPQEAYGSVSRTAVLAGAVADRNLDYRGREGGGQHGYIARHARKREDPIDHRATVGPQHAPVIAKLHADGGRGRAVDQPGRGPPGPRIPSADTPAAHDVHAVHERLEEARDVLRLVLEIGVERHDDFAPGALHSGEHRRVLAVVAVEADHPYRSVAGAERAKDVRRLVAAAVASSSAPAAEIVWPIIDLVELTSKREASGPNTVLIAAVSTRSFIGVEVPCALT